MNPTHFYARLTREAPDGGGGFAAPNPSPAPSPAAPEAPAAPPAPDYSWAGEGFVKDGALDVDAFKPHYETLSAAAAAEAARRAAVPEAYSFTKPDGLDLGDLKPPEGVTFDVAADDPAYAPLFGELGSFLKEVGAPADAGPKVVGLLTKYEASRHKQARDAALADYATLGATDAAREARIGAVRTAIQARLPAEHAKALLGLASTSSAVKALETLLSSPGLSSPSPTPPPAADDWLARRYPNR